MLKAAYILPGYLFDHWEINKIAVSTDLALIVNFPANSDITQAVNAVFRLCYNGRR
jgi:hypothetical protein